MSTAQVLQRALSSLREVLDRCVRRRGRRCCDGPHPRPVRRRSPGPDPDRPRPAGASAGARPAAGRRGRTVAAVARLFETGPNRIRAWRARFLAGGRRGLADEPRAGRPPKLNAAALAFLAEALEASPRRTGCRSRSGASATCARCSINAWGCVSARQPSTARCSALAGTAAPATICGTARTKRPSPPPRRCWPGGEKAATPPRPSPRLPGRVRGPPPPRLAKAWRRRGAR